MNMHPDYTAGPRNNYADNVIRDITFDDSLTWIKSGWRGEHTVKGGVSYHSSAGNEAAVHLEQDFVATPNSTLHDFAEGAGDNTNTVVVPVSTKMRCSPATAGPSRRRCVSRQ